jgi:STE24 endopeptidase
MHAMTFYATLFIVYLLVVGSGYWLRHLNRSHLRLHGAEVPFGLEKATDADMLAKTAAYTLEKGRVEQVEAVFDDILTVVFIFGGVLAVYDRWILSIFGSFVGGGLMFFLVLTAVRGLLGIPFDLYRTFHIENRYGFNTMTIKLWLTDSIKDIAVTLVVFVPVLSGTFALIRWSPDWWWLLAWAFFAVISLFVMYVSPYVIEPLFFTFSPVAKEGLADEITAMMEKAGATVSQVMQVDASRRSRHSNAYFTGIGKVKRIVLFDTLITQMNHAEILAVLAHELGHWKKGHIWKGLLLTEIAALLMFYIVFVLLGQGWPAGAADLQGASFPARLTLILFMISLAVFPLTPLASLFSRRNEREADRFSCELTGAPEALASALVKLSGENLANLHPHPLYAGFYYSHPPVVERVAGLNHESQKAPLFSPRCEG